MLSFSQSPFSPDPQVRLEEALSLALERKTEEFEAIFSVLPVPMALAEDAECRHIRVNHALAELMGTNIRTNTSMSGPNAPVLPFRFCRNGVEIPAEDLPQQRCQREGVPVRDFEIEVVRGDGAIRYLFGSATPLFNRDGSVRGSIACFADVTERRLAEDQLRATADHLRNTVELNPQVPWTAAPDGSLLGFSERWPRMIGLTREEALQAGWEQVSHPDDAAAMLTAWKHSIRTGEPCDHEHRIRLASGEMRWMRTRAFPWHDALGRIGRWYGSTEDIHDRKLAEEARRDSEERLRLITDTIDDAFWIFEFPTLKAVYMSPAFERLTGIAPGEDGPGMDRILEVVHRDDRSALVAGLIQATIAGTSEFEFRLVRPDGKIRWARSRAYPVRDDSGAILRIAGVTQDITARRRVEQALRESERIYRAIGESIPFGVWMCDASGRNTYVSESLLSLIGMTQRECSDFGWERALHPDDAAWVIPAWQECVSSGAVWDRELRFIGVDGREYPVLTRGVPLHDEAGTLVCWAGINLDIGRLKETEDALRVRTNSLQRSNQDLEQFAFAASHDLQEPLRMIGVYTELLLRRSPELRTPETEQYASVIRRGVAKMEELIRGLLTYSRIGNATPELTTIDLSAAVGDAVENCRESLQETAGSVIWESLPQVRADRSQISQVFQNLISNSIKYRRTGVPPLIHISAEPGEGVWTVTVQDNGSGFGQQYAELIFGLFKRLHSGADWPGTGLGLAICRRVIERHGGRIWAEAEPNAGATFRFTLPRA